VTDIDMSEAAPTRASSPDMYQCLRLKVSKGVAELVLDRPEALNSLNPALLDELVHALSSIAENESVKVLVLSGEGRAFCTGADLKAVIRLFDSWPDYVAFLYKLTEVCTLVENLPIPTIARVHGFALAGGLELLLCCDIAIAASDAKIGDQHANVGLIAGAGGIPRLTRRVGKQRALEILYSGRWLSGQEAADVGIVLKAVAPERLDAEITAMTSAMTDKSRHAARYAKRVALASCDLDLEASLNEERAALIEYFTTSSHPREGINSFLEKRAPRFG
jgi:enoyl-CoA hydratase/carnithine racemase